jgi:hypothetical protein
MTTVQTTPAKAPARYPFTAVTPKFTAPKLTTPKRDLDPTWRPEPCPLSRQELRAIVLEQIG